MQIYIYNGEKNDGPFSLDRARELVKAGVYSEDVFAWYEGLTNWIPVKDSLISKEKPQAIYVFRAGTQEGPFNITQINSFLKDGLLKLHDHAWYRGPTWILVKDLPDIILRVEEPNPKFKEPKMDRINSELSRKPASEKVHKSYPMPAYRPLPTPARQSASKNQVKGMPLSTSYTYPKHKPGYFLMRDANKKFVGQLNMEQMLDHISEYRGDFEIQFMDGVKWIPLTDLLVDGGEHEKRACEALARMSPDSLLLQASKEGDYELIKWALAEGADIHAQDDRALYFTVLYEHERCVQLLMNRGANAAADDIFTVALRNNNKNIIESFSLKEGVSFMELIEAPANENKEPQQSSAKSLNEKLAHVGGFRCPSCGLHAGVKMNSSMRSAFGEAFATIGSPLGALMKTYKCLKCSYIW